MSGTKKYQKTRTVKKLRFFPLCRRELVNSGTVVLGMVMPSCFKQDWVKSRRRGHPDDAAAILSELNTTDITANSGNYHKRWLVPEKQDNEQIKARSARIFNYFGAFQFLTLSQN